MTREMRSEAHAPIQTTDGVDPRKVDFLIVGGTLITVDAQRRIIDDGAIAIAGERIVAVGKTADLRQRFAATRVIDAHDKAVLPGLIDGHGHAGHGLVKTMGVEHPGKWEEACEIIYSRGSTEEFWRADALLTALERLKFGVTCGTTIFGGGGNVQTGDMVMRTDDPKYGDCHCEAVQEVGIREFLAVGPRIYPFPHPYVQWSGREWKETQIGFEDHLRVMETLVQHWHGRANGKQKICTNLPVYHPETMRLDAAQRRELRGQTESIRALEKKYGLLFIQDGHSRGSVQFAHEEFGNLGPQALLSHSIDLTDAEIRICAQTGTRIIHNPSAKASIIGRCPVPELLDAGVTVILGSDGPAPDRSCDMFRHMFQCMHYHRTHFKDAGYMPPGKVLEMVTIDSARALGMENDLGSLEAGKKADIILIDTLKPHLQPFNMPLHRIVYYANGNDVDTVMIDGKIVMENRVVSTIDEMDVYRRVQLATRDMLEKTNLNEMLEISDHCWSRSRY